MQATTMWAEQDHPHVRLNLNMYALSPKRIGMSLRLTPTPETITREHHDTHDGGNSGSDTRPRHARTSRAARRDRR